MLELSRHPGESIRLTGGIVITILSVRGQLVRVGLEAPPNIRIWRDEMPVDTETVREKTQPR